MERVIFVPFNQNCQHEFRIRSENWQVAKPSKNFQIFINQRSPPLLLNLHDGSQIYIRGHGLHGVPRFSPRTGSVARRATHAALPIVEVINRLIEMGLQPNYRGTIKFYSCFSGLDKPPSAQPPTGKTKRHWFTRKLDLKGHLKPGAQRLHRLEQIIFARKILHCNTSL